MHALATDNVALAGDIENLPLPELIQFFHLQGKDGVLLVSDPSGVRVAGLYYRNRQVVHAVCKGLAGIEAVYASLSYGSGSFQFVVGDVSRIETTVRDNVQNLILEGMRRLEVVTHVTVLLPDERQVLHLAPEPPQDDIRMTAKEWSILSLVNGKRTIRQIIEASRRPVGDVQAILTGLLTADLVVNDRNDTFLDEIVPKLVRQGGVLFGAQSVLGTLILKKADGSRTVRDLLSELEVAEAALLEEMKVLVRTGRVGFVSGEEAFQRWLSS